MKDIHKLPDDEFERKIKDLVKLDRNISQASSILNEIRSNTNFHELEDIANKSRKNKVVVILSLIILFFVALSIYFIYTDKASDKNTNTETPAIEFKNAKSEIAYINLVRLDSVDIKYYSKNILRFKAYLSSLGYKKVIVKKIHSTEITTITKPMELSEFFNSTNIRTTQAGIETIAKSLSKQYNKDTIAYHLLIGTTSAEIQDHKDFKVLKEKFNNLEFDTLIIFKDYKNEKCFTFFPDIPKLYF